MEAIIAERVAAALAAYETSRNGCSGSTPTSTGGSGGNPKPCSYKDFMNCKPHNYAGNGGVIDLTRWFEKTKSVFQICACPADCQVKFAACTFMHAALSWWNSYVQTVGITTANAMTWAELKAKMVEEYCPRSELQKLEQELWNLTMQGSDITAYTNRFKDLAVLCPGMVTPVTRKIERYIWGLAPQMYSSVTAFNPLTFESARGIAIRLTYQAIRQGTLIPKTEPREDQPKQKFWNNNNNNKSNNNNNEQSTSQTPHKKQHTITAYATTPSNNAPQQKQYVGNLPKCNKCNYHHNGECRELYCTNCKKKGHTAHYCKGAPTGTTPTNNAGASRACYACGDTGHFKRDCPKAAGTANGRVFAMGAEEAIADPRIYGLTRVYTRLLSEVASFGLEIRVAGKDDGVKGILQPGISLDARYFRSGWGTYLGDIPRLSMTSCPSTRALIDISVVSGFSNVLPNELLGWSPSIDLTPIVKQGSRDTVRKDWAEKLLPLFRVVTYVLQQKQFEEEFNAVCRMELCVHLSLGFFGAVGWVCQAQHLGQSWISSSGLEAVGGSTAG
ncbi:hypothetical protein LXL04_017431 [Taraxacum kok-saghyz]